MFVVAPVSNSRMSLRRVSCDRFTKGLDCLSLDVSAKHRVKTFARRQVGWTTENLGQTLAEPDQFDKAEPFRVIVDEQVHIAGRTLFMAGSRTE